MSAPAANATTLTDVDATAAQVVTFEPGHVVQCHPGESILFAGLRAGLPLSYECASGGCGSCKAVLVDGEVTSRWPDATGLTERDRRRGDRILLCQSVPVGSCCVRAGEVVGPESEPVPIRQRGRIRDWQRLTGDTARLVVLAEAGLAYLPGQFVILEFPDGTRRAYSMSRPHDPAEPDVLELLIRAKPGGAASAILFDSADPDDARTSLDLPLVVEGPYGRAYARHDTDRPVACLAGGTGLAPMLAVADDLARRGRAVHLYVGVRGVDDLVLGGRLLAMRQAGVEVVLVAERPGPGEHPTLGAVRAGLALEHLATDLADLAGHDVYLAGPAPMIDASLRRLVRTGAARADQLYFDRFIA